MEFYEEIEILSDKNHELLEAKTWVCQIQISMENSPAEQDNKTEH